MKGLESCQMRHNKGNSKYFTLRKRTWGASMVVLSRLRGCPRREAQWAEAYSPGGVTGRGGHQSVPSDPLLWELRRQFLQEWGLGEVPSVFHILDILWNYAPYHWFRHNKTIYLKIIHAAIHEIESLRSNSNAFYFTYLNNSHLRILSMCKFIILGTENSLSPKW